MRQLFRRSAEEATEAGSTPGPEPLAPEEHDWVFDVHDAIELARVVGRGRRSSVGVYGFSRGGLILEAGRLLAADGTSEDDARREFSPMIARVRLPAAWRCVVIAARDALGLSGPAEREAFARLPPVTPEVTAELAQIALLELLPAAVEGRFAEFAAAVRRYGDVAGRPFAAESERLPHAPATAQLLELLGIHEHRKCADQQRRRRGDLDDDGQRRGPPDQQHLDLDRQQRQLLRHPAGQLGQQTA
jgi:hypothetical protein